MSFPPFCLRPPLRSFTQRLLACIPAMLPSCCALCGAAGSEALCPGCRRQFLDMTRYRCDCCGVALENVAGLRTGVRCGACLRAPPAFDATVVACDYAPPMDGLALALKFGGRLELVPLLAQMLQQAIGSHAQPHAPPELLTVVPLGPRRLVERGFNQSLEIAKPLSRSLGIALAARLLQRTRDTQAQALLHPDERHRNIRNAFIVRGAAADRVRGRHIGVIDDIMTTGETLNELAATLKRFGAARVTNFVFARTLPN